MADWLKIKAEYISGCGSMRELAEKHGVSVSAIKRKSAKESWTANRTETERKVNQETVRKVIERTSDREADRIVRLLAIGDRLGEKLERAAAELGERYTVKRKTARVDEDAEGNAISVEETTEIALPGKAAVTPLHVKQLASALKDLRDVARDGQATNDSAALSKARELLGGVTSVID